jgi:threonine dehydratase
LNDHSEVKRTTGTAELPVTPADIKAAAQRLKGKAVVTPLLSFPLIDKEIGFRLLVKAETLQLTGSFKFRGACNKLMLLREQRPDVRSVVAFSSGNHAQGVAAAAAMLGFSATIVMPDDAPRVKIENTKRLGATVVLYQRHSESREEIAAKISAETNAALVPPYDDPAIMAGQGTAGLEINTQLESMGIEPDVVIAPCSGGGLVAGVATAVKDRWPKVEAMSAEPADFDDLARSLKSGERLINEPGKTSICDALLSPQPGVLTFAVNRELLARGLAVDDATILKTMRFALLKLKMTIEPGGSAALACALQYRANWKNRTVVVVASGGNADAEMINRALEAGDILETAS